MFRFLKDQFIDILLAGTVGKHRFGVENRITIFTNVTGLVGLVFGILYYFQLDRFSVEGVFNIVYLVVASLAASIIILNLLGRQQFAKLVTVLLLISSGWHAMFFFGKSFNGYQLFFVAIVFSATAFSSKTKLIRWTMLGLSLLCLPAADYFSHRKLLPVTDLNSGNEPLGFLLMDTALVSFSLVALLLLEKFFAEKNESELILLNKNLEEIVAKRTALLDSAREEAMTASRAKSRFVANTSHELRTPLNSIIGFVDLLLDAKLEESERRRFLEIIKRSGNQLLQIVNDILDLSKIEAEKMDIEEHVFSPQEMLEEVKNMMTLKAVDKGLGFKFESRQVLPKKVVSDPLRIKQILVNLIGNAVKFTSKGGIVVTVQVIPQSDQLVILQYDISDTGPGISVENVDYLFRPFSQLDSSLNRNFGGSGLGLSLSKSLAEQLGGELTLLESEPNKGSTFRFRIPCKMIENATWEPSLNLEKDKKAVDILNGKRILLVDDSVENQILSALFLRGAGAEVDVAENGQMAIEIYEKQQHYFDLILMDLQMPILDGYEATRILRAKGYQVPIIAFTAHAMKDELENAKSAGFNDCLTKPIKRQILAEKVAAVLNVKKL